MTPSRVSFAKEPSDPGSARPRGGATASRRRTSLLVVSAVVVGTAITAFGVRLLQREMTLHVATWEGRLSALGDDRKAALETWIAERKNDASLVAAFPSVVDALSRGTKGPLPPGSSGHLEEILADVVREERYLTAALIDSEGGVVACSGTARLEKWPSPGVDQEVSSIPTAAFGRLADKRPAVVLTMRAGKGGSVVFLTDPAESVYRFLLREPGPTRTGECLLGGRKGESAVILSPVRHRPAGAPPLELSLSTPGLAIASALTGEPSTGIFSDYRGVKVLAATRRIAGTEWALVAKVDLDEALAEADRARLVGSAVLASLLLALAAVTWGIWRDENARRLGEAARSEEKYRLFLRQARDPILLVEPATGRILDVNPAAEAMYERPIAELVTMSVTDLCLPSETPAAPEHMAEAGAEGLLFETTHLRADGTPIRVEVSSRRAEVDGREILLSIARDVSARHEAQEREALLNRLLRTLSEVNQLIVRETDAASLLESVCRIAVEHGGFHLAWIGLPDEAQERIVPAAQFGTTAYMEGLEVRLDASPLGLGPTGRAFRERRSVVVDDWERDESVAPWRERALGHGLRASGAFPLLREGRCLGVLTAYSGTPGFFRDEVVALVAEMAGNVAFALDALAHEEARRAADREILRLNADLEMRVQRRTAELEAVNRDLEAFSYSVSHDLRAPLRAIDGFGRIIEEEHAAALGAEGGRLLGVIRANTKKMGDLIEDLLAFSRAGRQEIRRTRVDMRAMAASAWKEVVPAEERGRSELVPGELPAAAGDPALLRQVWTNLISNAVKFTSKKPSRRVEVGGRAGPDGPEWYVRDDGAGFDMRYAGKLFGVFSRLHGPSDFEGTGVGLALVQRIVARHGGTVRAQGEPGRGATFSFSLPEEG